MSHFPKVLYGGSIPSGDAHGEPAGDGSSLTHCPSRVRFPGRAYVEMAELADALDLGSSALEVCGFNSHSGQTYLQV